MSILIITPFIVKCGKVNKNAFIFEDCKHCVCLTCEPQLKPDSTETCPICKKEGRLKTYDVE